MEQLVSFHAAPTGLDVALHDVQGVVDRRQVLLGSANSGQGGKLGLQCLSGLDDLGELLRVLSEGIDHLRRAGRFHQDDAVAVPHRDHAGHFHGHQRLTDGGAAHPQPCGELAFGR